MLLLNFLLGCCGASFGAVVTSRPLVQESFIHGRSHCDFCQQTLRWYHEIPILSYLWLRGKCSFCQHPIAPGLFLVELAGGFWGLECTWQQIYSPYLLLLLGLSLLSCAWSDYLALCIDPRVLFPSIAWTLIQAFPTPTAWLLWSLLALGLLGFYYFFKPRLGFGDVEILLVIALVLGLSPTLYVTVLATSLALLYFGVCKLKRQPLQAVPFVPFIMGGLVLYVGGLIIFASNTGL